MDFTKLARKHGFDPDGNRFNNTTAVVRATEEYVAKNDPTFQDDLYGWLRDYFSPGYFATSCVKRIKLKDALEELYGPPVEIVRGAGINGSGRILLYINREKMHEFLKSHTAVREVKIVQYHE